MMEFIKTKKNYLIGLAVLFVFISLSGPTYSLFLKQESTSEFNYNTGILDLTFTEDKPITLDSAFPTIDSEGAKQKPYNLTIKNTGSLSHLFDLKMISTKEYGSIDYRYIKVKVNDYLPHTLASTENVIADNILLNPGEEITLNIRIWLDSDTPNNELGKSFAAKIISSGQATYRTLDNSGANHPTLADNMLPVYYDETTNNWRLADRSNNNNTALWYNYDNSVWANSVILNESTTYIFDELRNNDLEMSNIKVNNSNLIIDNKALDIKLSAYNYDAITQIMRIKFTELPNDYIYLISNGQISYYYDNNNQQFVFKNGGNTVTSSKVTLEKNTWHIIGYTYNGNKVVFYLDGTKINDAYITGSISKGESFKIATNNDNSKVSRMTIGDILTYHKVLSDNDFASNFKTSMNPSKEGLVSAYREFTPMTLKEYYQI